jgi:hypothetical protein
MSVSALLCNVRQQAPVDLARVAVAVCPPTSAWRIRADRLLPDALLRLCGWQSDFVRTMASERFVTFDDYWREIGRPVRQVLRVMSKTACTVRRDVTFREFERLCTSGRFDIVFLVAHHMHGGRAGAGSPEFSDGPKPVEEIYRVITGARVSLILFSCESSDWRDEIVARSVHASAAGGAPWRLPFRLATLFLLYWLRECDGVRTLDEALARAIRTFMDRKDDEVPCE